MRGYPHSATGLAGFFFLKFEFRSNFIDWPVLAPHMATKTRMQSLPDDDRDTKPVVYRI